MSVTRAKQWPLGCIRQSACTQGRMNYCIELVESAEVQKGTEGQEASKELTPQSEEPFPSV